MKTIFLGKNFIRALHFPNAFLESIDVPEEINLR